MATGGRGIAATSRIRMLAVATAVCMLASVCTVSAAGVAQAQSPVGAAMPQGPAAAPCAKGGVCKVGDRGPGGGIVVIAPGSVGNFTGKYFEAAPRGWHGTKADPELPLCTAPRSISADYPRAIGTGLANTARILGSRGCRAGSAAAAARGYAGGGKRDWFLPSPDEAAAMVGLRARLGLSPSVFADRSLSWVDQYSTSQRLASPYDLQAFGLGVPQIAVASDERLLTDRLRVRPMRSFSAPPAARTSCVVSEGCEVGDIGPGGGTVFITPETPGNLTGLYFEAAPRGWNGTATDRVAATATDFPDWPYTHPCDTQFEAGRPGNALLGTAIGAGAANTGILLSWPACATSAAAAAHGYAGGGLRDWSLPSLGELAAMTEHAVAVGGLTGKRYEDSSLAHGFSASPGTDPESKGFYLVRPVRSFGSPSVARTTCAAGQACKIGDIGPGGGTVFITPATPGNATGKYFEVAPEGWTGASALQPQQCFFTDESRTANGACAPAGSGTQPLWATLSGGPEPLLAWCSSQARSVAGTQRVDIGAGSANTDAILAVPECASGTAAAAARAYAGGGLADWFLPSKDELNAVYAQRIGLGMFGTYWSSSEKPWLGETFFLAFGQNFSTGVVDSYGLATGLGVRPVRMF